MIRGNVKAKRLRSSAWVMVALVSAAFGCASSAKPVASAEQPENRRSEGFSVDDQSRCDWQGREDREVNETTAVGAFQPNVRRVYQLVGQGYDRKRVLICREVDTNLDGIKDVVRLYTEKGELQREEADTNYDGRVDSWMSFANGHVVKHELDRNGDGMSDVWKFYNAGKLSRVQRDTNYDGKPDVWEIYVQGKLDRIGVDLDFDGRVDRWDRDEQSRLVAETKERQELEEQEKQRKQEEEEDAQDEQTPAKKPQTRPKR